MENYHRMLQETMANGIVQLNRRTGKRCRTLAGYQLQFDLREGFPAITTKKLAFKSCVGEILGFFRGYESAAQFRELGCKFWDQNANETQAWLNNRYRQGTDHIGKCYGAVWRAWECNRVARTVEERDHLLGEGYTITLRDAGRGAWLMTRSINQLETSLKTLLTNPSDRRVIVSAWKPDEFDRMALPPCHMDYRFIAFEDPRVLHLVMTQRSVDSFLGLPANATTSAIFLSVMARLAGFEVGTVTMQLANVHIYEDHEDQVRELLSRSHFAPPRLVISDRVKPIGDLAEIQGAFERIEPDDFTLAGYQSHAAIKAPMAA